MITAFVRHEATRCQGAGRRLPAAAVRSFLRFLVFRGEVRPGSEAAAPSPPQWQHAPLPPHLTPEEVARVLAVYHDGTASSLRNRAMLLLLARLGLRTQDVIALSLDDIDWADGRLDFRPASPARRAASPCRTTSARQWWPTYKAGDLRVRAARSFCAVGRRSSR